MSRDNAVAGQSNSGGRGDGRAEMEYRRTGSNPNQGTRFVYDGPSLDALNNPASSSGGGGAAAQSNAVQDLLDSQQRELDLLRETDPVQKEMLRNREALKAATDLERAAVEEVITTRLAEQAQLEASKTKWDAIGDASYSALEDIIFRSKSAAQSVLELAQAFAMAALKATLLGQGPLAGAFGTSEGGGLFGGLVGLITGKAAGKAGGGMIHGPGTGTSDEVPIWASDGEFVVTAAATARNRGLLEAINSGVPLPNMARGYAAGGLIVAPPGTGSGGFASAGGGSGGGSGGGAEVHNHFHISTPNPKAFAEDRISTMRGAQRVLAQARRFS